MGEVTDGHQVVEMAGGGKHLQPHLSPSQSAFETGSAVGPGAKFEGVSLAFVDVSYTIAVGKGKHRKQKVIIENASGYVRPGSLVAIMGPTGSGKTSLLNILAGRVEKSRAELHGEVLVNGGPRTKSFGRISSYVMQDDVLFSTLTVWETLITAATLRLPSSTPAEQKLQVCESIIAELGLAKARDTQIGNELSRGVSGGERKRTNIAIEMLSNPSLIFLDEPTSGLDSFQAMNVMSTMADLAHSGRTVISTIHQPRSSIFALFENLLLLSEGRMVYYGPASEAVSYFTGLGYPCPEHFNPADYFMDIISMDRRDETRERASADRIGLFSRLFRHAPDVLPSLHSKSMAQQAHNSEGLPISGPRAGGGQFASSWVTQFQVLYRRAWWQTSRDKLPLIILFVQIIIITLVVIVLFSGIKRNQKSIQDRTGLIFFTVVIFAFNGVFQIVTTFPMERGIIKRERASNSYRVSAYYPAKVLAEMPLRALPVVIYVIITYFIVHFQQTAEKFFLTIAICALEYVTMQAAGLMISSAAPTPQAALALGPLMTVIFMVFAGFFVNANSIPAWIRWARNISPIQWGFIALSINQLDGLTFACTPADTACVLTGRQQLTKLSLENYTVGQAIGYQALLFFCFHTLAYFLLWKNGPKLQPLTALKASDKSSTVGADVGAAAAAAGAPSAPSPASMGPKVQESGVSAV